MNKTYSEKRPSIPASIQRVVRTSASHKCTIPECNIDDYLEIHHIDQNRENNNIDNLILLCDRHHKMAHDNKIDKPSLRIYLSKLSNNSSFNRADEVKRVLDFITWMKNIVCEVDIDDGSLWLNGSMLYSFEYHIYDSIGDIDLFDYRSKLKSFDPEANQIQDQMIEICFSLKKFVDTHRYRELHTSYKLIPDVGYEGFSTDLQDEIDIASNEIKKLGELFQYLHNYCERR